MPSETIAPKARLPYPGLRPFEQSDAPIFYGRHTQIVSLIRQLRRQHFVAVIGASGSGKSSLVKAGLLPAIEQGALGALGKWNILILKPGNNPADNLAQALSNKFDIKHNDLKAKIRQHVIATHGNLHELFTELKLDIDEDHPYLLVIDQFEELFDFLHVDKKDNYTTKAEASAFVRFILNSVAEKQSAIRILITMRTDFMGDCELFLGLPEAINQSQFLVPRLNRELLKEAIIRPAAVKGQGFGPFVFPENLADDIINELGTRSDYLPLMQHALMRTWKIASKNPSQRITVINKQTYQKSGGIYDALNQGAEEAWQELQKYSELKPLCRPILLLFCEENEDGRITRRRPKVKEICQYTGASINQIERIIHIFQRKDRNFILPLVGKNHIPLTPDSDLDISHEALIRNWKTYKEWQEQEQHDYNELKMLTHRLENSHDVFSPLTTVELSKLTDWKKRTTPNWGQRYLGAMDTDIIYPKIVAYIKKSEIHHRRAKRKKMAIGLLATLGVFTLLAVYAHHKSIVADASMETAKAQEEAATQAKAAEVAAVKAQKMEESAKNAAINEKKVEEQAKRIAQQKEQAARSQQKFEELAKLAAQENEKKALRAQTVAEAAKAEAEQAKTEALEATKTAKIAEQKVKELLFKAESQENSIKYNIAKDAIVNDLLTEKNISQIISDRKQLTQYVNKYNQYNDETKQRIIKLLLKQNAQQPNNKRDHIELLGHSGNVSGIKFIDRTHLMSWGSDKTLRIWDIQDTKKPTVLQGSSSVGGVTKAIYQKWNDQEWILTGSAGRSLRSFRKVKGQWSNSSSYEGLRKDRLGGHLDTITALNFARSSNTFVSGSAGRPYAILWNLNSKDRLWTQTQANFKEFTATITSTRFSPSDTRILFTSDKNFNGVHVYDIKSRKMLRLYNPQEKHKNFIRKAIWINSSHFVTLDSSPNINIWLAASDAHHKFLLQKKQKPAVLSIPATRDTLRNRHTCTVYNAYTNLLALGGTQGTVSIIKVNPKNPHLSQSNPVNLTAKGSQVLCLALHPKLPLLAVGREDGTVELWNYQNSKTPMRLRKSKKDKSVIAHKGPVWDIEFSPDGKSLATCSGFNSTNLPGALNKGKTLEGDGVIRIWNISRELLKP